MSDDVTYSEALQHSFLVGPIGDNLGQILPSTLEALRRQSGDDTEVDHLHSLMERAKEDEACDISLEAVSEACAGVVRQMINAGSDYAALCTQVPAVKAYLGGAYRSREALLAWTQRTTRLQQFNASYWHYGGDASATRWDHACYLAVKLWAEIGVPVSARPREDIAAGVCVLIDPRDEMDEESVHELYSAIFVRRDKPQVGVTNLDKKNPHVYALSYKHQERHKTLKEDDFRNVLEVLKVKHQVRGRHGGYFALWIDVALPKGEGEWLDRGLLPYVYFGVVAVQKSEMERRRLWLWLERDIMDRKCGSYEQDRIIVPAGTQNFVFEFSGMSSAEGVPCIVVQGNALGHCGFNPVDRLYKTGLAMLSSEVELEVTYASDKQKIHAWFHNYFAIGAGTHGVPRELDSVAPMVSNVDTFLRRLNAEAEEYSSTMDDSVSVTGNGEVCWLGAAEVAGSLFVDLKLGQRGLVRKGQFEDRHGHFVLFVGGEGNDVVLHVRTTGEIDDGHAVDKVRLGGHLSNSVSNVIVAGLEFEDTFDSFLEGRWDETRVPITLDGKTRSVDDIRWTGCNQPLEMAPERFH